MLRTLTLVFCTTLFMLWGHDAHARGQKRHLEMNYGPFLMWTYEVGKNNFAYKGIAVRLDKGEGGVSRGRAWMIFDHDTMRVAAAWTGDGELNPDKPDNFINWRGVAFDESHGTHPSIVGDKLFVTPEGPGWARPGTKDFTDNRFVGRKDNRYGVKRYGPVARDWAHYKGLYKNGQDIIIKYSVGKAHVLEQMGFDDDVFSRILNLEEVDQTLYMRVAPEDTAVACAGKGVSLEKVDGFHVLKVTKSAQSVAVYMGEEKDAVDKAAESFKSKDLGRYTMGGKGVHTQKIQTKVTRGTHDPYAIDTLEAPDEDKNPWNSWMRFGGHDFLNKGKSVAIATWMGDLWLVDGIEGDDLSWQRVASGMFQPLGVKVVNGEIYVTCRDQIAKLHDLNGDGEIDFYESFNNDHQVSDHFHEFAMGLQTDKEGNFYYAKSARHAKKALVAHHGTLIKVSRDGKTTEIVANGFRAANGVCVNDDGSFFVTDQEGHWVPKNRINWVKPGGYYGNFYGYHKFKSIDEEKMDPPLVWITNSFDRSPAELLWVTSDKWGPVKGALLNISYGTGKIFVVPHEKVNGQVQGGVSPLPLRKGEFPTGNMRGRFNPHDGQLYTCGLFAWAGSKHKYGGFYRVRYTGKTVCVPVSMKATEKGMVLTFSTALDKKFAEDDESYAVKIWDLKRGSNYGSKHYNEKELVVDKATLLGDGKTVMLTIPDIQATWCMEIKYDLKTKDGTKVRSAIHNSIHHLGKDSPKQ